MSLNHSGNAQPAIDKEEHTMPFGDNSIAAKSVVEMIPSGFMSQKFIDYDARSDDNPVYVGFNYKGALTTDTNWLIQKITYDGANRVTMVQIASDSWDNRVDAVYA